MLAPVLLALLIVPLVELYVLIQVGEVIGAVPTILLLIVMSILGGWLLKREGTATWRRLQEAMRRGQMPAGEVADGAMILFGGALMLTPGFITDVFGLLLILPPTRTVLKGLFRRGLGAWFLGRAGIAGNVGRGTYAAKVIRSRRRSATAPVTKTRPTEPPTPPSLEHPDAGAGSRDRA